MRTTCVRRDVGDAAESRAAATPVRSGRPPAIGGCARPRPAAAVGAGRRRGCASARRRCAAGRSAPARRRSPPRRRSRPEDAAISMRRAKSSDLDRAARGRGGAFGSVTVSTPSLEVGGDRVRRRPCRRTRRSARTSRGRARPGGSGRRAVAARRSARRPRMVRRESSNGSSICVARDARHLGGDDVAVVGLVDVDRRRPGVGVMARQPLEALLPRAQIAQRIPRHAIVATHVARPSARRPAGVCYDPSGLLDARL